MGKNNYSSGIKAIISSLWHDGVIADSLLPGSKLRMTGDRFIFAKKLTQLIMQTEYTGEYAKAYYSQPYASISEVYRQTVSTDDSVTLNSVKNQVRYNSSKIRKHFGENMLEDILVYSSTDIKKHMTVLDGLCKRYLNTSDLRDELIIEIPSGNTECRVLSDEEFDRLVRFIKPYTKYAWNTSIEKISEDMWGYLHYLDNSTELEGVNKTRFEELSKILFSFELRRRN